MPTIASENRKNYRQALEVYVHIQQLQNTTLTFNSTGAKIQDLTSVQTTEYDLRALTDLSGNGFPLDGSCILYDSTESASVDTGKVGIRSSVGTVMRVTVSAPVVINALTLRVFGSGTITANGTEYEIREYVVIPVNSTSVTMTVTPDAGNRVSIEDIQAGITLDFDNNNLVSCNLDLESDLALVDSSWRVSSIEVQGFYPDDISEAVSNMGDGVPIIYYAGYPGDYSKPRYFYISEAVTQKEGLITIKGEDASEKLDLYTQPEALWQTNRQNAKQMFYRKLCAFVKDAGINVVSKEAEPPLVDTDKTKYTVVLKEASFREYVQYLMDITNKNGFYPRFVDAGIPTLRWSTPAPKWDIYKDDIGDYERVTERNINKIYGDEKEKPLHDILTVATKKSTIDARNVTKGKKYSIDYGDNYYYNVTFSNALLINSTLHSMKVKAIATTKTVKVTVLSGWVKKTKKYKKGTEIKLVQQVRNVKKTKKGDYVVVTWEEPKFTTKNIKDPQIVVQGYKITGNVGSNIVTSNRLGVTKEVKSLFWGRLSSNNNGSNYFIPKYDDVFNFKSNKSGSFTWKGNPHMQPRDVFRLYETDGETYTVCTIESIETKHEGGGMISTITYREGVY